MRRAMAPLLAALATAQCTNAGEDRLLSVTATGVVRGLVYFDANGNLEPDLGDDSLGGVRVRLVGDPGGDTVATATSQPSGTYRFASVPVGAYRLVVDTAPFADTVRVTRIDSARVTVSPSDSLFVNVAVSYPTLGVAAVRALPEGRRVFVIGVTLNTTSTFADSAVHFQDSSGAAIRLTRVRATVFPSDSVRVRGTTARRAGQPTLDDVRVFLLGDALEPTAVALTTAAAATAAGGTRDAALAVVRDVTVSDTATAGQDFRLTVTDGSGALEVLLDRNAAAAFRPPVSEDYVPGNRFDVVGVLSPTGTGLWRLKPRSAADLRKL